MRSEDHYTQIPKDYNEMTKAVYNNGFENGLNKAWDLVKYLFLLENKKDVLNEIYNEESALKIINFFNARKAIEKYEKWERAQNIQIGDILVHRNDENVKMIVISINNNILSGFSQQGVFASREKSSWRPTGLNVQDELNELYKEINDLTKE